MRKGILTCVAVLLLAGGMRAENPAAETAKYPKREFRGAWYPTVTNTTWRDMTTDEIKADIIRVLDAMASVNVNAVLFQVRPQADALFVSDLEPWSRFLTGEQGVAPDPFWDPTAFVIEECHKRGMEMHAWFNPYRVTSNDKEKLAPDHLYFKKPEMFVKYGKQLYFDPGLPESREHIYRVIKDFVSRYDVDAVHFDDYFYPYRIGREEFPDEASFLKYHEKDGFSRWDKLNWRRNNVNVLVKNLNDTIKSVKPWVKFGISPFGVWRNASDDENGSNTSSLQTNYDDLFADVRLWCQEGWIDYSAPQAYQRIGHARADYDAVVRWWSENKFKPNLYIGQNVGAMLNAKLSGGRVENQLYKKMDIIRECGNIDGNIWWPGTGLVEDQALMDSLRADYQAHPALMPSYPGMDSVTPASVKALRHKDGVLTWKAPLADTPLDEALFYAVYRFEKGKPVQLDDASCLVAVVGETRYEIPADTESGTYVYVVTALDRLWNESRPVKVSVRKR